MPIVDPSTDQSFHLALLGRPRLERRAPDGGSLHVLGRGKPLALLAYLALTPERRANRDMLCDLLWGDRERETARASLRSALWAVRRSASASLVSTIGEEVTVAASVATDVRAFDAAITRGDFVEAMQIHAGEFVDGYYAPGAERFESWAAVEAARLRSLALGAAESLARSALREGRPGDAVEWATRSRCIDPAAESGWMLMIETLLATGQLSRARAEAVSFEEWLRNEGRAPDAATRSVLSVIGATPERAGPDGRVILPQVGREREMASILERWQVARSGIPQWIHLRATAGMGKTRLLNEAVSALGIGSGRLVMLRVTREERSTALAVAAAMASQLSVMPGASGISPAAAGALVALDPLISGTWPGAEVTAQIDLRATALAMVELITVVADEHPVVIAIDDVQWMDPDSWEVMRLIASRLQAAAVLLVTTSRPRYGLPPMTERAEVRELAALTLEDVDRLLEFVPVEPRRGRDEFVRWIHARSGGNPGAITDILRRCIAERDFVVSSGRWTAADPEGAALALEAGERGAAGGTPVDPSARRLARVLALAGVPLEPAVAARAASLEPDHAEEMAATLESQGVIACRPGSWIIADERLRRGLLKGMSEAELLASERSLAEAWGPGAIRHVLGALPRSVRVRVATIVAAAAALAMVTAFAAGTMLANRAASTVLDESRLMRLGPRTIELAGINALGVMGSNRVTCGAGRGLISGVGVGTGR